MEYRQATWMHVGMQPVLMVKGGRRVHLPVIVPARFMLLNQETGELEPDPNPD